ncbi:MAG: metallophosphoesterase, partial [Phormidesmis sp.]
MPLNRRRFVILSGLALSGAAAATSCRPSSPSANASAVDASAAESAQTSGPVSQSPISNPQSLTGTPLAPTGLYAPPRGDIRLAVISDLNSAYGSTDYRREVIEGVNMLPDWQPDMVVCGGDMVA